jgi:hypothetical protein
MIQPTCQFCGGNRVPEVHHIEDFADHPDLELDPSNLITLCEGPPECHLRVGHMGNWHTINPSCLQSCKDKVISGTAVPIAPQAF